MFNLYKIFNEYVHFGMKLVDQTNNHTNQSKFKFIVKEDHHPVIEL